MREAANARVPNTSGYEIIRTGRRRMYSFPDCYSGKRPRKASVDYIMSYERIQPRMTNELPARKEMTS